MSSTQLQSVPDQPADFGKLQKLVGGLSPEEGHDYTCNLLWKREDEFQEVLYYWSSRFRAIYMEKLSNPIEPEFQRCWEQYYGSEVVSIIWLGPVYQSHRFVKGFMLSSIGMAVAHGHDVSYDRCLFFITHNLVSLPSLHSYSPVFAASHCTLRKNFAEMLYGPTMISLGG
jgi:hypothetical protein